MAPTRTRPRLTMLDNTGRRMKVSASCIRVSPYSRADHRHEVSELGTRTYTETGGFRNSRFRLNWWSEPTVPRRCFRVPNTQHPKRARSRDQSIAEPNELAQLICVEWRHGAADGVPDLGFH